MPNVVSVFSFYSLVTNFFYIKYPDSVNKTSFDKFLKEIHEYQFASKNKVPEMFISQ